LDRLECAKWLNWDTKRWSGKVRWIPVPDISLTKVKFREEAVMNRITDFQKSRGADDEVRLIDGNRLNAEWYWIFFMMDFEKRFVKVNDNGIVEGKLQEVVEVKEVNGIVEARRDPEVVEKVIDLIDEVIEPSIKPVSVSNEADLYSTGVGLEPTIGGVKSVTDSLL
jgi:hypothetical protein